jgi:hypothetical protein
MMLSIFLLAITIHWAFRFGIILGAKTQIKNISVMYYYHSYKTVFLIVWY